MRERYQKKMFITNDIALKSNQRILFFDYLRLFLVFSVIFVHSTVAYAIYGENKWHVFDPVRSIFFDIGSLFSDYFIMAVFFFIAGFFALPSIQKRGILSFIKKKFFRLIVPFILGMIFVIPFAMYIRYLYFYDQSIGFFEYWFFCYWKDLNQFMHLWFLPALFIFFLFFAFFYSLKKDFFEKPNKDFSIASGKSLFVFVVLTGLIFYTVRLFLPYDHWVMLGDFYFVQPSRYIVYFSFFLLGILFYRNRILSRKEKFLKPFPWISLTFLLILMILSLYYFFVNYQYAAFFVFIDSMLRVSFCLSIVMTLLFLFSKYMNFQSVFLQRLSANVYAVYIIHYPFVVALQYYLIDVPLSVFVKFFIVFSVSTIVSFLISEFFLRRLPLLKKLL